jgi:hypothetical protein
VMLPGNILAIEAIVRQSAVDHGYPYIVSWCDRISKFVSFIGQIIAGLITRKNGGKNDSKGNASGSSSASTPGK